MKAVSHRWTRWLAAGALALAGLWGCTGQGGGAQPSATSPAATAPQTEEQRCVAGGGTWDTTNQRIPPYCAKGTPEQCRAQGGNWQRVCMMGSLACVKPYADAGKACTDGSECAGKRCLAPQGANVLPGQGPMQGQCIANDNPCYFGINIEKGYTVPTAVAD